MMFPRTVARVNSAVMLSADTPLSVAEVAKAADVAYTPAASALATLEKRGLVRRLRRAGRDVFEPDHTSVYYPMAYGTALVDLPVHDAVRGQRIYLVMAYGSLASPGGGTESSDLDLFIVGDVRDRSALTQRLAEVGGRLHRTIDPFILTPEAFELAKETGDLHVASAMQGVRLMGSI